MRWVIVAALIGVLAALASAGAMMLRHKPGNAEVDKRMARALTIRVGVSVVLFALVLLAHQMGWIEPTGLRLRR